MCNNSKRNKFIFLPVSYSMHEAPTPMDTPISHSGCQSELNVLPKEINHASFSQLQHHSFTGSDDYYKKYDHDDVPVKDSHHCSAKGDKISITNSKLDELEKKIFKNTSPEIQKGHNSSVSLESNLKLFKTTVEEIFNNFYANMRDYELYKQRFHEILAKNKDEAIDCMEDFIKDMIQNIMSSESSLFVESKKTCDASVLETLDKDSNTTEFSVKTNSTFNNFPSIIESYKNDNYFTDSTLDEAKGKSSSTKEEILINLYGTPCIEIRLNDRNLLSEINITDTSDRVEYKKQVASADNMKKLAEKQIQLEQYICQEEERHIPDREIPVKISNAKKNIHLNEDFANERQAEKSIIFKICTFLCKKFRKSS